jgi:O-antigen/teichoic acid export membrane protein
MITSGIVVLIVGLSLFSARFGIYASYQIAWPLILVGVLTIFPEVIAQYALDTSRLQFAPLRFCVIALVKNLAGLLIGVWLLIGEGMGLLGLLVGNLISAAAAATLGLWLVRADLVFKASKAYIAMLFRFGAPFIFTAGAYWMFSSLDRWMLAEMSDTVQVGLFSIALKFASVLTLVIGAFHQAWVPIAMRMSQEDPDYRRTFSRIFSGWFFILSLMALGLGLFAEEVMMVMTPESYWPAAQALAIAAAAVAVSGTTQVTSLGVTLEKRTGLIAVGAWIAAGVNVSLNLLLIPDYGAEGAALALLLSYAFLTLFYLFWSQRLHPIPLERGKLFYALFVLGAAIAMPTVFAGSAMVPAVVAVKLVVLAIALAGAVPSGILTPSMLREAFRRGTAPA